MINNQLNKSSQPHAFTLPALLYLEMSDEQIENTLSGKDTTALDACKKKLGTAMKAGDYTYSNPEMYGLAKGLEFKTEESLNGRKTKDETKDETKDVKGSNGARKANVQG